MRAIPLIGLAMTLLLSGCFESSSPVSSSDASLDPASRFQPSGLLQYTDKIVLASSAGAYGPSFLTSNGAWVSWPATDSSIHLGMIHLQSIYSLTADDLITSSSSSWNRPWLDSELWIDAPPTGTILAIYHLPPSLSGIRTADGSGGGLLSYDLANCPDLGNSGLRSGGDSGSSIRSIVRVGRFVYLVVQPLASTSNQRIVQLRLDPAGYPQDTTQWIWAGNDTPSSGTCNGFSSAPGYNGIAARWVTDTAYRFIDGMAGAKGGLWVHSTNGPRGYISFIDSTGRETVVDSTSATNQIPTGLFSFHGRVWGVGGEIRPLAENPPQEGSRLSMALGPASSFKCGEVKGRCIAPLGDQLWSFDSSSSSFTKLTARGLEGDMVTGIVQYKDTVYVSTLSGVFTKPVARFFDPAP